MNITNDEDNIHSLDEDSTTVSSSRRDLASTALADHNQHGTGCEDSTTNRQILGNRLTLGNVLKIATWNCGGLSYTQRDLCTEYAYDLLVLTETHDRGKLKNNRNFITAEAAPANDSFSGVAILLSDRAAKCVMHSGSLGSRIVYAKIRSSPCDLFIIGVYIPHKMRKSAPFAADTMKLLETLVLKAKTNDCVVLLGDFNCKLGRNIQKLAGKWCIHKTPNTEGKQLLELMRRTKLTAVSTFFQPRKRKSNATFLARDPRYKPSQIDYILISSRWVSSVRDCKVKWGIACQRWGRHYDHGMISCLLKSRIRMRRKTNVILDFSQLKSDQALQSLFEEQVRSKLSSHQYDRTDPTESLSTLQDSVSSAATTVIPKRASPSLRRRNVSSQTRDLFQSRQENFYKMNGQQRKAASRAISNSAREDYRSYVSSILSDIEVAHRTGNTREVTRLTKVLSGKTSKTTMPSKDLAGEPILSSEQLLSSWNSFLAEKFAAPPADSDRQREHTVSPADELTESELQDCLNALKNGKAPGFDSIPIEAYKFSNSAKCELFRVVKLIWDTEIVPPDFVKGIFIMIHKKNDKNIFSNYRAICLLCHAYKLLSSVIARRLRIDLEPLLPDSQAGFRPARGTRDNVCILKWTINMLLREEKPAVVTFIDYSAAFDTESQLFLDEALSAANVSAKVRRVIQSLFSAASGCVRLSNPDGSQEESEAFDISRGVLQGDIFSPVAFIAGLMRTFALHDRPNSGVTVGAPPHQVTISSLEYADDAGLFDSNTQEASARVSAIAIGSREDAAMDISIPKTKAMHIHKKVRVSKTEVDEIAALKLKHACPECTRGFSTTRGLAIHRALWCLCDPAHANTRSRAGSLADAAVQRQKRIAKENELDHVTVEGNEIENVYSFVYLGNLTQCDGDDKADVKHRMNIAQARFHELHHIWKDHRLPLSMKLSLYKSSVCSTLSDGCEAWILTKDVCRKINGFNSRCLNVITRKPYRETAVNPDYNLLLAIRQRRLRYLGHILRLEPSRLIRRTLNAFVNSGTRPPVGSLLEDCETTSLHELAHLAADRSSWRTWVNNLR